MSAYGVYFDMLHNLIFTGVTVYLRFVKEHTEILLLMIILHY